MTVSESVGQLLIAVCEGQGVTQCEPDEFEVFLNDYPTYIRTYETPPVVTLYREIARGVPWSVEVAAQMRDENSKLLVFRLLLDENSLFLRADLSASPFSAQQLQCLLESFESEAESTAVRCSGWAH